MSSLLQMVSSTYNVVGAWLSCICESSRPEISRRKTENLVGGRGSDERWSPRILITRYRLTIIECVAICIFGSRMWEPNGSGKTGRNNSMEGRG